MLELHEHKPPKAFVLVQFLQQLLIINTVAEFQEQKLLKLVRNLLLGFTAVWSNLTRALGFSLRRQI